MIRFVVIGLVAVFAWFALTKLIGAAKRADIDWTGVATMVAFVTLAFWLRHVTGMG